MYIVYFFYNLTLHIVLSLDLNWTCSTILYILVVIFFIILISLKRTVHVHSICIYIFIASWRNIL